MPPQPYDNCPCGSGKKFKFCCQSYFAPVQLALEQQEKEQHEACLKTIDSVVASHPTVPQVWGYKAQVYYNEGKVEEAETALDKALELNPSFGMGMLLRALFRMNEGEMIGALMLFRKAAEAFDPQASEHIAQTYEQIARLELNLNRVVASRAALAKVIQALPNDAELKVQFDGLFGPQARMPECARKPYSFRKTLRPLPVGADTGKLSDAKKAFEQLTTDAPNDPACWFNLGLVRAWLGEQPAAVDALMKSVELEMDEGRAEETAALAEVLRCGQGMENDANQVEHRVFMPVRDIDAVSALIQAMGNEGRLVAAQVDESGSFFTALVVEELPSLLETGAKFAKIMANMSIAGGVMRFWHPNKDNVEKVAQQIRDRINLAVGEPVSGTGPIGFGDVAIEAVAYPMRNVPAEVAETKLREYAQHYFEDVWAHRPLKSLGGVSPVDATGSKLLRKKLLGILRYQEDCLAGSSPRRQNGEQIEIVSIYDFSRLRHKLGAEVSPSSDVASTTGPLDFAAMSAADLAGLSLESLTTQNLADAIRAALKLDARELAVAFAKAGSARPVDPAMPDRYPFYFALITGANAAGNPKEALEYALAGEAYDATNNESKRANEYAVRKGELKAKTGDIPGAVEAFESLLSRVPDEAKFYVIATEALLRAKAGPQAVAFAEKGMAKAKESGNRDLEGACAELHAAAKKLK